MKHNITIIRRSCTTNQVVWIYQGPSKGAARLAYWRARKHEITRVRGWQRRVRQRADTIQSYLDDCMNALPLMSPLSKAQREAIKTLQAIIQQPMPCDTVFYNHIRTMQKRKQHDAEIRRKMREREAAAHAAKNDKNMNYDK